MNRETQAQVRQLTGVELKESYSHGTRDFRRMQISDRVDDFTFNEADFSDVVFIGSELDALRFVACTFVHTQFDDCFWNNCSFESCVFRDVIIARCRVIGSQLIACETPNSRISDTTMGASTLRLSNLAGITLSGVHFLQMDVVKCDLDGAVVANMAFTETAIDEFCRARGIRVFPYCTVDWQSVCLSLRSPFLSGFLLASGMPEVFVTYLIDCARAIDPRRLFEMMRSTFISYGAPDAAFARLLRDGLQRNGVRTFLFDSDAIPGERLHRVMYEAVHKHDRIVLVCSKEGLQRKGVLNEIEQTLSREARSGGVSYLIPITLDDFVFTWVSDPPDIAIQVRDRVVADFCNTNSDEARFRDALQRLLHALMIDRPDWRA